MYYSTSFKGHLDMYVCMVVSMCIQLEAMKKPLKYFKFCLQNWAVCFHAKN